MAYSFARRDRSGAQVHDDLFAYAYCHAHKLKYLGSVGDHHFEAHADLCRFLGIPSPSRKRQLRHLVARTLDPKIYWERADDSEDVKRMFTPRFLALLRRQAGIATTPKDSEGFSVAVHVRRGDVTPVEHPDRYLYNAYYVGIIRKIVGHRGDARVTIFSESDSHESFSEFEDLGCQLELDTSLTRAWAGLMSSNVLIMSKSSFSYVPALFNQNTVIYAPFWHKPLAAWIDASSDGFEGKLSAELSRRTGERRSMRGSEETGRAH